MLRFTRLLIPLFMALAITWASHQQVLPGGVSLPHPLDKVAHGMAYAVFGGLVGWGWGRQPSLRPTLLLLLGIGVFGALDEWHQSFVPGRDASLWDWCADVVGAAAGLLVHRTLTRNRLVRELP